MRPYLIHRPQAAEPPVIIFDSPHSGTGLPRHFRYACARQDLMHLHDPHVEKLLAQIPASGAAVLEAKIHRTCIDLNRFADEINPEMIIDGWPHNVRQTRHTAQKLGLFPVRAGPRHSRNKNIYTPDKPLTAAEARHRIKTYHRPYYAALYGLMNQASCRHGHAVHVNVHSFYRRAGNPDGLDDIIIGDRNGTTCAPAIIRLAEAFFRAAGHDVGFNGPDFSGGALILSTANIGKGWHSLQIEIARDLYMNPDTLTYHPENGRRMGKLLTGLAAALHRQFTL